MELDDISDISFKVASPTNKNVVVVRGRHQRAAAQMRRRSPSPAMARQRQQQEEESSSHGPPPELPQMLHPSPSSASTKEKQASPRASASPTTRRMSQRLAERRHQRKMQHNNNTSTTNADGDGGSVGVVTASSSMEDSKLTTKANNTSSGRRTTVTKPKSPAKKLNSLKKNQFQQQPPPPSPVVQKEEERDASKSPTPYRSVVSRAANRVSITPPRQRQQQYVSVAASGSQGPPPIPSAPATDSNALRKKHAATKERMSRRRFRSDNNASPMPSSSDNARAAALRRQRFQNTAPPPPVPKPDSKNNHKSRQQQPQDIMRNRSIESSPSGDLVDMSNHKRSFLYRSRHTPSPTPVRPVVRTTLSQDSSGSSAFSSFDEQNVTDPMQRAGLRLLSAAVIPIQAAARRHLALRAALVRMWAIVLIQTTVRRWSAQTTHQLKKKAAIDIQRVSRGMKVRDQLLLEHCCAIEIQRRVRGFLATVHVYEAIYKITVVQSIVRRQQAIGKATDRMILILQLQSLVRGFLERRRMFWLHYAASVIQATWRGAHDRLNYRLDVLDIVIAQSAVRRKLARVEADKRRAARDNKSATIIQTQWRGTYARMSYQLYILVVIEIQNFFRKAMAKRALEQLKFERDTTCATHIQTAYRGYSDRLNYTISVLAIVDIQCYARRMIAKNETNRMREEKQALQLEHENLCATKIQSAWRGFDDFSRFVLFLNSVIVLQSNWRRMTVRNDYLIEREERRNRSATLIQKEWRGFVGLTSFRADLYSIIMVQSVFRRKTTCEVVEEFRQSRRYVAAAFIQAWGRRLLGQKELEKHKAARTIQASWRSYDATMNFLHNLADVIMVQGVVRRWLQRHRASCKIQSVARMHAVQRHNKEVAAATVIQCQWRSFVCYADYMFTVADIIMAQSVIRRFIQIRRYKAMRDAREHAAARTIQKASHRRLAVKDAAAIEVQRTWRGFVAETQFFINIVEQRTAIKIQSAWRRFFAFSNFVIKLDSTIRIQSALRGFLTFRRYEETVGAAIIIQNVIRIYLAQLDATNESALRFVSRTAKVTSSRENQSALKIQTGWRCSFIRRAYVSYIAARKIQTAWRCKRLRTPYVNFIAARRLQCFWRSVLAVRTFVNCASARLIQTNWRRFYIRRAYVGFSAACKIQTNWRRHTIQRAYGSYRASSKIQAQWRGRTIRKAYVAYIAARKMQAATRRFLAFRMFVKNLAAMKLQAIWRMHVVREYFAMTNASICIQKYWRCFEATRNLKQLYAARQIQSSWRCYWLQSAFIFYKASRKIQTRWRTYSCSARYQHMLQQIREYCAATSIQSAWRMKSTRLDFIDLREDLLSDKIDAAIKVQKVWRGMQVRDQGYRFVQWIFIRDVRDLAATIIQRHMRGLIAREQFLEYSSAIKLQKIWRGYRATENYWHQLGSAIQIQAIARGWIQYTRYNKQILLAPTIQRSVRCYFAREELARRKFILKLVNQVNKKSPKSQVERKPAKPFQDEKAEWTTVVADRQRIDRAARILQKFFRMVKKEVDRAVRAEKKKRRHKTKDKRRRQKATQEDDLLENVWNSTSSGNKSESRSSSKTRSSSRRKGTSSRHAASKSKVRKDDKVILSSRRQFENSDEGTSVVSYWSNSNSQVPPRVPKSRKGLSAKEKHDDLALETAWMDTSVAFSKGSSSSQPKKKWNGVPPINTNIVPNPQRAAAQPSRTGSSRGRSVSNSRGRSLSVERRAPRDDDSGVMISGKMGASSSAARQTPGPASHIPEHLLAEQRERSRSRSHSQSTRGRTYRV
mmetsp:Transcript_7630/g.15671  ORF Transcript_7630/g.15671 Transcript_7630/m.15671 type:complete len:1781 (+) Transcript_7630:812-6154(+)